MNKRTRLQLLKQATFCLAMVGIVVFLLWRIPLSFVWSTFREVSLIGYAGLLFVLVVTSHVADSYSYWLMARKAAPETAIAFWSMIQVRAASQVLSIINYAASQGGLVYLWKKKFHLPVSKGIGIVLIITASNLLVLCVPISVGFVAGSGTQSPAIRYIVLSIMVGGPLYLFLVYWSPVFLRRIAITEALLRIGVVQTLKVASSRGLYVTIWVLGHWLLLRFFGVEMGLGQALVRLPLMFLIAAIPITPGSIGTAQAAAVMMLSDFAPGATVVEQEAVILAYSISTHALHTLSITLIGIYFGYKISQNSYPEPE